MGTVRLTDAIIRRLEPPATGNRITYDNAVKGFGARVTANGVKSFVLTYVVRGSGRQRRYTIGGCDRWTATDARDEAKRLKARVDIGADPLADLEDARTAPTMADLVERFRAEHYPRLRASSAGDYERMIRSHVLPHFGERKKVADVAFADVDALHRKITRLGYAHRANRTLAVLSKAFTLAIKWGWRTDNPCRGIERNREHARRRYLSGDELVRLIEALARFPDKDIADVVKMLLLTGARRSEVFTARWADIDVTAGTWSKPPASTKQNEPHTVPLSAPARTLLAERLSKRADGEVFVFPSNRSGKPYIDLWHAWGRLCKTAGIEGMRLHDLRHSYASQLASAGHSLPLIGALLGHTQPATTARYAHLLADPLRKATEQVGAIIENAGKPAVQPTPIRRRRRS
jgi:integrase